MLLKNQVHLKYQELEANVFCPDDENFMTDLSHCYKFKLFDEDEIYYCYMSEDRNSCINYFVINVVKV